MGESLFANGQSELDLECGARACSDGILGLVAWQDRKSRSFSDCTVVVAHSTRSFAKDNWNDARRSRQREDERGLAAITRALARLLQIPQEMLEGLILDSKVIHWRQGQVQRFMARAEDCLSIPGHRKDALAPLLVLCGDYFTEATFSGCSRSAHAAAASFMDWLEA